MDDYIAIKRILQNARTSLRQIEKQIQEAEERSRLVIPNHSSPQKSGLKFTEREMQVILHGLFTKKTMAEVAQELGLSPGRIRELRTAIERKLKAEQKGKEYRLNGRIRNALRDAQVTLDSLKGKSVYDIMKIPGIGESAAREIFNLLN